MLLNISSEYDGIKELQRVIGFNENVIRSGLFVVDQHQNPSKLKVAESASDHKAGKSFEVIPSSFDIAIEKIVINNL